MQTQNSNPIPRYVCPPRTLARTWGVALLALIVALLVFMFPLPARAAPQAGFACTYVVRPGDDLYRIGLLYNVSWWELAIANSLPNPHLIFAGMILRVPCPPGPPVTPPPSPSICDTYIVKRGEWLGMIGDRYGVSWQDLAAVNRLPNPNLIYPDQRLLIPCKPGPQVTPTPDPALTDEFNQVVSSLVTGEQVTQLNSRTEIASLLPSGGSVLDYVNRARVVGWKGPGACPASQDRPYQVMSAPVIPGVTLTGRYGTFLGVLVLPACTVSRVLQKGFALENNQAPTIYAMVVMDSSIIARLAPVLVTPSTQGPSQQAIQGPTPTPVPGLPLNLYSPSGKYDLLRIPGTQTPYYLPAPEPIVTLGSICIWVDGIIYCWP